MTDWKSISDLPPFKCNKKYLVWHRGIPLIAWQTREGGPWLCTTGDPTPTYWAEITRPEAAT